MLTETDRLNTKKTGPITASPSVIEPAFALSDIPYINPRAKLVAVVLNDYNSKMLVRSRDLQHGVEKSNFRQRSPSINPCTVFDASMC